MAREVGLLNYTEIMTPEPLHAPKPIVAFLLVIDSLLIVIFAVFGIASHSGSLEVASIARVAIPFLLPYLLLAMTIKPTKLIHNVFPIGVVLWISTVVVGPILRAAIFNDTSALPFILVSAGVLALFLLGRRGISTLVARRNQNA